MNLVTLVNDERVTLASGSLVYAASETNALADAVTSAEELSARLGNESERIDDATEMGRSNGYEAGYAEGLELARAETGSHLAQLTVQAQLQLEQQREQTLAMAVQIVKKITANLATDEVLVALARTAARECGADESISLSVHPEQLDAVKQRIEAIAVADANRTEAGRSDLSVAAITEIFADEALATDGCVLHTRYGSVVADLKTQLEAIENNLTNTLADNTLGNNHG